MNAQEMALDLQASDDGLPLPTPDMSGDDLFKLGLMYSTMLSLFGFYLVRGTVVRDFETGVWQLLVATPMHRAGYVFAKWLSHLGLFALLLVVDDVAADGDQEGEAAKEHGYDGKGADRIGLHAPIVSAPSCHLVVTRSPLSCT